MSPPAPLELFVSGRVCLFGEHSDWAATHRPPGSNSAPGLCLAAGTDLGITSLARPLDGYLEVVGPNGETAQIRATPANLVQTANEGGFFSYAAGTLAELMARYPQVTGLQIRTTAMTLPLKKGLSSSAAICVSVARACNQLFGLGLDTPAIMDIAFAGERRTPSMCGRLDQVCAYGRQAVSMTFDRDTVAITPVVIGQPIHLILVDLGGEKDTVQILDDLQRCFPDTPGPLAAGVRRALSDLNHALVLRAASALSTGDAAELGRLMDEAQGAFDRWVAPASPTQLGSPRLKSLLTWPSLRPHICGGKGMGSQGDGVAQLIVRDAQKQRLACEIIESGLGMQTMPMMLQQTFTGS